MKFHLIAVENTADIKKWHQVPHTIYRNDDNWIAPLEGMIEDVFTKGKNVLLDDGEAKRWFVLDQNKNYVGRIAAFYNPRKANKGLYRVGGAGFFECIDNQEVADLLFDTARQWLEKNNMQVFDAPVNFGENDNFWGLLVEGFEPPVFGMNYNPPYYQKLFENYGFIQIYEQISKRMHMPTAFPERLEKIMEYVKQKHEIEYVFFDKKNVEKFVDDLIHIYNDAWVFHPEFTPLKKAQVYKAMNNLKDLLVETMITFAYVKGEPAGFFMAIPDFNQIIKPFKGKIPFIEKIKLFLRKGKDFQWYVDKGILTRGRVTLLGIRPKFQRLGLESGLIITPFKLAVKRGFVESEISWVGDYNPKMMALLNSFDARLSGRFWTMRYAIDNKIVVEKKEAIPVNTKEILLKEKE